MPAKTDILYNLLNANALLKDICTPKIKNNLQHAKCSVETILWNYYILYQTLTSFIEKNHLVYILRISKYSVNNLALEIKKKCY